jgi:hypothetical protein
MARNGHCGNTRCMLFTPSMSVSLTCEPDAPYTARALLAALLPHWRVADQDLCERALVVVSELVSHTVLHGQGEVHLDVALQPACLRLQVTDRAECEPAGPAVDAGSGLHLVDGLATGWGVQACRAGGTRVFAELEARAA